MSVPLGAATYPAVQPSASMFDASLDGSRDGPSNIGGGATMFQIGTDVYTTDGRAGKLIKVIPDAAGAQVTHLVVEKGFRQTQDRVVPRRAVAAVTDEAIRLNVSTAELERFPQYHESYFISEGMLVCDRACKVVGKVQLVYAGGASDAAVARALRLRAAPDVAPGPFGSDDLPPDLQERMLRQGYIRIEGPGITGARRYVLPEQIAGVVGNRVRLYASRAELKQQGEPEKSLSFMGRINEGMPVCDRNDHVIGSVKLVYYGGASAAAVARASLLAEAAAAANEDDPLTFDSDEEPPELQERMLRQGYIRIEGPGITGARRYVLPEQIARVGDCVQLHATRDELITPGP